MLRYSEDDEAGLRDLLVGKSVVSATIGSVGSYGEVEGRLTLSDGTVLAVGGNAGCGGCSSGWYDLTELNTVDNIITNVQVIKPPTDSYEDFSGAYRVFVFADNEAINLATFEGDDRNGYYGTGFWVEVIDG